MVMLMSSAGRLGDDSKRSGVLPCAAGLSLGHQLEG